MAYEIISQNNNTTTLSDGTNTITVPARVTLATSTSYTITEVNNSTATLEGSDGSVIRDVPCVAVLAGGGGSDTHNKGFFATQAALEEAYPTGEAGDYAIVGATDTVWIWDEDSSAWVDTDTKGQVESVNGKTGTVVLNASDVDAIQQYTTMPTAVDTDAGRIVQYVGTTSGSYTNGYFYIGKVSATPSQATITQTVGNSLSDLLVDKSAFGGAVSGESGTYAFVYDGEYWNLDSTHVRLTDYGISFTGTPVTDDGITVVFNAAVFLYYWERTDVQPNVDPLPSQTGNSGKYLTTDGTDASWENLNSINLAASLPTADATLNGSLYFYTGATTASYLQDSLYKCMLNAPGTAYYWKLLFCPSYFSIYSPTNSSIKIGDGSWGNSYIYSNETVSIGIGITVARRGSVCIGHQASTTRMYGVTVGKDASANGSITIGYTSSTGADSAIAIGTQSSATSIQSLALGERAKATASSAIQIGQGTNSEAQTFCVGLSTSVLASNNYKLLDSDGTIPTDRFTTTPVSDGTYVPTLTISSGVATRTWGAAASAPVVPATAPTLVVADWSSNTQTITVSGVTSSNVVLVGPAPSSAQDYADAGIICVSQSANSLTFECQTVPSNAITLSVVIFN